MRSATKEERESVDRYIKSISHKTGIMFDNLTSKEKGDAFYEAGWECAIDRVLETISEKNKRIYIEHRKHGEWESGYTDALDELEEAVLDLKGKQG